MERELCPKCYKVVSVPSRYKLVKILGNAKEPLTVGEITKKLKLSQPTVTHHLGVLESVGAVIPLKSGRNKLYSLDKKAHCFEECNISFE